MPRFPAKNDPGSQAKPQVGNEKVQEVGRSQGLDAPFPLITSSFQPPSSLPSSSSPSGFVEQPHRTRTPLISNSPFSQTHSQPQPQPFPPIQGGGLHQTAPSTVFATLPPATPDPEGSRRSSPTLGQSGTIYSKVILTSYSPGCQDDHVLWPWRPVPGHSESPLRYDRPSGFDLPNGPRHRYEGLAMSASSGGSEVTLNHPDRPPHFAFETQVPVTGSLAPEDGAQSPNTRSDSYGVRRVAERSGRSLPSPCSGYPQDTYHDSSNFDPDSSHGEPGTASEDARRTGLVVYSDDSSYCSPYHGSHLAPREQQQQMHYHHHHHQHHQGGGGVDAVPHRGHEGFDGERSHHDSFNGGGHESGSNSEEPTYWPVPRSNQGYVGSVYLDHPPTPLDSNNPTYLYDNSSSKQEPDYHTPLSGASLSNQSFYHAGSSSEVADGYNPPLPRSAFSPSASSEALWPPAVAGPVPMAASNSSGSYSYGDRSVGSNSPLVKSKDRFRAGQTIPPPRNFKCSACPASFSRNHDLKRHARIHLAVKPFPCSFCDKSFSRKDALKRHILVKGCGAGSKRKENPSSKKGGKAPMMKGDAETSPSSKSEDLTSLAGPSQYDFEHRGAVLMQRVKSEDLDEHPSSSHGAWESQHELDSSAEYPGMITLRSQGYQDAGHFGSLQRPGAEDGNHRVSMPIRYGHHQQQSFASGGGGGGGGFPFSENEFGEATVSDYSSRGLVASNDLTVDYEEGNGPPTADLPYRSLPTSRPQSSHSFYGNHAASHPTQQGQHLFAPPIVPSHHPGQGYSDRGGPTRPPMVGGQESAEAGLDRSQQSSSQIQIYGSLPQHVERDPRVEAEGVRMDDLRSNSPTSREQHEQYGHHQLHLLQQKRP